MVSQRSFYTVVMYAIFFTVMVVLNVSIKAIAADDTRTESISDVRALQFSGEGEIEWVSSADNVVVIKGEAKAIAEVSVTQEGRTLIIDEGKRKGFFGFSAKDRTPILFVIKTPDIQNVAIQGAAKFTAGDVDASDASFVLKIKGAGQFQLANVDVKEMDIYLQGASHGSIENIKAQQFTSELIGASHYSVGKAEASHISVEMRGASHIYGRHYKTDTLDISATGACHINVDQLHANKVSGGLSGASHATLQGEVEHMDVKRRGVSQLAYTKISL